jgi:ABC-type enterochelin transport system substrate-binding protein
VHRLLLILAATTLALSACGGDDDSASEDTAADTTEATDTTTADTTADTAEDTTGLCAELEALADIDPEALPTQADVDRVTAAAESAPPEIADALTTVAAYGQLIADEGPEALDAETIAALEAQTDGPAVEEASQTLVAFTTDECGIDVPLFASLG